MARLGGRVRPRGRDYVLAAIVVATVDVTAIRRVYRQLLLPGASRLHSSSERPALRKTVLRTMGGLPLHSALVAEARITAGEREARAECLRSVMAHVALLPGSVTLIIESRGDRLDRDDRRLLQPLSWPDLQYRHARPAQERLLRLPDFLAWAAGAPRQYRDLLPEHERLGKRS